MGVTMHAKSDSDATSLSAAASPQQPLYFVQSPSHHDKMSYGNSSPFGSPPPHYTYTTTHAYLSSPLHHSRESSTSRFSARAGGAWKRLYPRDDKGAEDGDVTGYDVDDVEDDDLRRFYIGCFLLCFVALFTIFSLILWAASTTFPPKILVQEMIFRHFSVQAATDHTGVPTDMMDLNSTVMIKYHNPATFFGVHVSSTPFELHYYQLKIASGHMKKFYQSRKSQRRIVTSIFAKQVPLYGSIPYVSWQKKNLDRVRIPLNLTFVMKSRAFVLGRLVKPTFYQKIRCEFVFRTKQLGKPVKRFVDACTYYE